MKVLFVLVFVIAMPCFLQGQEYFRVKNVSVEDGLSQSSTRSLIQDDRGFLWIGTNDGLNRYDGNTFKTYRAEAGDSTTLPSSYISCLKQDSHGNLWIGYAGGISTYQFDSDNFLNHAIASSWPDKVPLVYDIEFLSSKELLIGTEVGLFRYDLEQDKFYIDEDDRLLQGKIIRNIYQTKKLGLCIATNTGLYTRHDASQSWKQYTSDQGLSNNSVYSLFEDNDWIIVGTANGVDLYNSASDQFASLPETKNRIKGFVQSIIQDFRGNIWIGAQGVLVLDKHYHPVSIVATNPNPISTWLSAVSETTSIYQTKDSSVWIGKGSGLLQYIGTSTFNTMPIATENVASGMMTIFSVYTDDDSKLYVGSINGLYEVDLKTHAVAWHFRASPETPSRHSLITAIFKDRYGTMWLGTGNGLIRFSGGEKESIRLIEGSVGDANQVIDIAEVGDSILALTIQQKGLWFLNRHTSRLIKEIPFDARAMLVDEGNILVGFQNRILVFDLVGNLIRESKPLPAHTRRITEIFKDSKSQLWIATEGSGFHLWNFVNDTFESYSQKQGLNNPVVYCILEDNTGQLWLSTNNGLVVFNPDSKTFVNFGIEDGLQATEFNTGAAFKSSAGTMYFGGIRGLNYFTPEKLLQETGPIETYITAIFVNNNPISTHHINKNIFLLNQLDLTHKENSIAFQLTSLDYIHPHRIRYQYQLENFENKWLNPIERNFVSFTNLPPGNYVLRVRSSTGNGKWSLTPIALNIRVHAPFWLQPSYQAAAFILFVLAGFVYNRIRVRRLKQAKKHLESIVLQRTKEIQVQKEEIAAQNEELTSHTEIMALKNIELETKSRALEELTHQLESKVEERTQKLNMLNRDLIEQNIRLEQFSYITAHNLRGPIASIKGLLNIFPAMPDQESRELLKRIDGCSDRLFEIVSDLTFVLGVRDGSQNTLQPVQLRKELDSAIGSLRKAIEQKKVQIILSNFNNQATIAGVKTYVQSIFYNLIHNAIKYSSENTTPQIEISCTIINGKVKVMIRDNGIGIDMQYAEGKVFQLYQRFNTHTQGKGLGLFLVKNEVDTMGGTIWLESSLNKGTTIFIEFDELTETTNKVGVE